MTEEIKLPKPPDYIFKSREMYVREQGMYRISHAEYPLGGCLVYYEGVELPQEGLSLEEGLRAIRTPKRIIVNALKNPLILAGVAFNLEKSLNSFIEISEIDICSRQPTYYLKDEYYCEFSRQIRIFIHVFLSSLGISEWTSNKTAEIVALMFESDDAYRLRVQDPLSTVSKQEFLSYPGRTLDKIIRTETEREVTYAPGETYDYPHPAQKFRKIGKMLKYLLWIPKVRKAFREGLKAVKFEGLQLNARTVFHSLLREDYDVKGFSLAERESIWRAQYGNDTSKLPPRIVVTSTG